MPPSVQLAAVHSHPKPTPPLCLATDLACVVRSVVKSPADRQGNIQFDLNNDTKDGIACFCLNCRKTTSAG